MNDSGATARIAGVYFVILELRKERLEGVDGSGGGGGTDTDKAEELACSIVFIILHCVL
jgi:hypothetical protein